MWNVCARRTKYGPLALLAFGVGFIDISSLAKAQPLIAKPSIGLTPANTQELTVGDVLSMLSLAKEVGSGVVIYTWNSPGFLDSIQTYQTWAESNNVVMVYGLSPTARLDRGRIVVPDAVADQIDGPPSFTDPLVREAFVHDAVAIAEMNPPYLCLGTEINFLALDDTDEFFAFVDAYKEAYDAVKEVSPDVKVFTTVYWDVIYLEGALSGAIHGPSYAIFNLLRPRMDAMGLTTYPGNFWDDPANVPDDLYSDIEHYLAENEPLIMMEIGWPTETLDDGDLLQDAFIERLPELFSALDVELIAWSLMHDVPDELLPDSLGTTGLRTFDGAVKPGWDRFLMLTVDADNPDCGGSVNCEHPACTDHPNCTTEMETICGNSVCESGENCQLCPDDCESRDSRYSLWRFCCGDGVTQFRESLDPTLCDGNN